MVEFPHLGSVMSLQDVALVVNLWEDKEGRLQKLHGDNVPAAAIKKAIKAAPVRKR